MDQSDYPKEGTDNDSKAENRDSLHWKIVESSEKLIEGAAPLDVDESRLKTYLTGRSNERESRLINFLVANYREWYQAAQDILTEIEKEGSSKE